MLEETSGWQHDVRIVRRVRHEQVMDHREHIISGEPFAHQSLVRQRGQRVGVVDEHHLDPARLESPADVDHVVLELLPRSECGPLEIGPIEVVDVRRVEESPVLTYERWQDAYRAYHLPAVPVPLHPVSHHDAVGAQGDVVRDEVLHISRLQPRQPRHRIEVVLSAYLNEPLEPRRVELDELLWIQPGLDYVIDATQRHGGIGHWFDLKMDAQLCGSGPYRVDDVYLRPALLGLLDHFDAVRSAPRRVHPPDDNQPALLDLLGKHA